ncbi:MAG: hypothetical protein H6R12_2428 [Proteobacteria bacterium]|nr:hypothetical protein [Pseudomonadota bacterium]
MQQGVINALRFDAFDHRLDPHHLRHGDAGLDQVRALGRAQHLENETLVHLDGGEGQPVQRRQRREAGAVVVHRQWDAGGDEVSQTARGGIAARHHRALRDLDLQVPAVDLPALNRLVHQRQQARRVQILRRDVERDGGFPELRPGALEIRDEPGKHRLRDVGDEAVSLGYRDEGIGLDDAAIIELPADEGFRAAHLARQERGFRLIVEEEFAAAEGAPDIRCGDVHDASPWCRQPAKCDYGFRPGTFQSRNHPQGAPRADTKCGGRGPRYRIGAPVYAGNQVEHRRCRMGQCPPW